LQQNCGRHTVDGTLPLFAADIGGDEKVFRSLRREPLIPENQWYRQAALEMCGKIPHRLDRRTFPSVQLQGETQDHFSHRMLMDKGRNMGHIAVDRPALEGLERLSGPAQLIAERHPDPLGPVIQRQYP
jgi:hypothetical protein